MKIPGWDHPSLRMVGYLHLPGMFQSSRRYKLFSRKVSSAYLDLSANVIEIIQTRNTKQNPCDENTSQYDQQQIQGIFDRFGCRPYYFNQGHFQAMKNCEKVDQLMDMEKLLSIKGDVPNQQKYR
jgi:hypothetical protein